MDTPFGTSLTQHLNPVPNELAPPPPKKNAVRMEVFVGPVIRWTRGGRGGTHTCHPTPPTESPAPWV